MSNEIKLLFAKESDIVSKKVCQVLSDGSVANLPLKRSFDAIPSTPISVGGECVVSTTTAAYYTTLFKIGDNKFVLFYRTNSSNDVFAMRFINIVNGVASLGAEKTISYQLYNYLYSGASLNVAQLDANNFVVSLTYRYNSGSPWYFKRDTFNVKIIDADNGLISVTVRANATSSPITTEYTCALTCFLATNNNAILIIDSIINKPSSTIYYDFYIGSLYKADVPVAGAYSYLNEPTSNRGYNIYSREGKQNATAVDMGDDRVIVLLQSSLSTNNTYAYLFKAPSCDEVTKANIAPVFLAQCLISSNGSTLNIANQAPLITKVDNLRSIIMSYNVYNNTQIVYGVLKLSNDKNVIMIDKSLTVLSTISVDFPSKQSFHQGNDYNCIIMLENKLYSNKYFAALICTYDSSSVKYYVNVALLVLNDSLNVVSKTFVELGVVDNFRNPNLYKINSTTVLLTYVNSANSPCCRVISFANGEAANAKDGNVVGVSLDTNGNILLKGELDFNGAIIGAKYYYSLTDGTISTNSSGVFLGTGIANGKIIIDDYVSNTYRKEDFF